MSPKPYCVVTTINPPTAGVQKLSKLFPGALMAVGDNKTPSNWSCDDAWFLPINGQHKSGFEFVEHAPQNHYARKNIGYLQAMRLGASVIYDTDDDNIPSKAWHVRSRETSARTVGQTGWCNVYRFFHSARMWPRGLPLDCVLAAKPITTKKWPVRSSIQQGLANLSPDVDAIWRLVMPQRIVFNKKESIALANGVWCPFNSQTTWWWPEAYPLMYLPVYATFRMTDIWRSFVAQRCLWELGSTVTFHSPAEAVQERNPHDLMRDFKDEIPGYLRNQSIAERLGGLTLKRGEDGLCDNLIACYDALITDGTLPSAEMASVMAWVSDVRSLQHG